MSRAPVAVLGVGGVGGMLAARTGAVCVGTERTVAAIRERGLTLRQGDDVTVVHPDAVERLERPVSLLVVAVKAYDLESALDRIAADALANAVVLPLVNGLEHVERLRVRLFPGRETPVVAAAVGSLSAWSPEPGVVVQVTHAPARISAASRDLDHETLVAALAPLEGRAIEVIVGDREGDVLWEKAARLAVLAAATITSGRPVGELRDDPAWRERILAALDESVAVAAADGVRLTASDQWAKIGAMPPESTTSAARDAAAGGPTELDAITGSVVRAGERLAVATPVLAKLLEEARCRA